MSRLLFLILLLSLARSAFSADRDWSVHAALLTGQGVYENSVLMKDQNFHGLKVTLTAPESYGFSAGVIDSRINMQDIPDMSQPKINQKNYLLSGFLPINLLAQSGRWTLKLDSHFISNDDPTKKSTDVSVFAPQIMWQSTVDPVYSSLSLSKSHYPSDLTVNQVSPAVGIGFNSGRDWVQWRGYLIGGMNPNRAEGLSKSRGSDFKVTHLTPNAISAIPHSLTLGVQAGKRIYAVDMDAQVVYNLPMVSSGGHSLGATWDLFQGVDLTFYLSRAKLHSETYANDFKLRTQAVRISKAW